MKLMPTSIDEGRNRLRGHHAGIDPIVGVAQVDGTPVPPVPKQTPAQAALVTVSGAVSENVPPARRRSRC